MDSEVLLTAFAVIVPAGAVFLAAMTFAIRWIVKSILDAGLAGVNAKLAGVNAKIDTVSTELNAKIDTGLTELNAKIDTGLTELNAKIDTVSTELNAKIDTVSTELNAKIDTVSTELNARLDGLEDRVDRLSNTVETIAIQQADNGAWRREADNRLTRIENRQTEAAQPLPVGVAAD